MARLIDADKIMDELRDYADRKCANGYMNTANGILSAVNYIRNNVTRVDAVEVVRCKDCKFGVTPYGDEHDGWIECSNIYGRPLFGCNDFCSYGERKDGAGMDCFNYSCPFRVNQSSSINRCECSACPNRCNGTFSITSNRTLTDAELAEMQRQEVTGMPEYIEREAAIESIMSEPPDAHYPQWYADKIKAIPAADVAPVRHGDWMEWFPGDCALIMTGEEMLYRCSSCDAKYYDVEGFRFCPHCGARMDLEVSNGKSETVWYAPQGDSK